MNYAIKNRTGLQVSDLLTIALRRKKLVVASVIIVTSLILLVTLNAKPLYEARASLAIDQGSKPMKFDNDDHSQVEYNLQYSIMNTQRDLLLSNQVLETAFKASRLRENRAYRRDPIVILRTRLHVSTSRDTQIMSVALRDEDQARAEASLQLVIASFIESEKKRVAFRGDDAVSFLTQQVAASSERVEKLRAAEEAFQSREGILSTDPDHNSLTEELAELRSKNADLDVRLIASQGLMEQIHRVQDSSEHQGATALLAIADVANAVNVVDEQRILSELLNRQVELSQKYLDKHPRMIEMSQMVAAKRLQLDDAIHQVVNGLTAENADLTSQSQHLLSQIKEKEAALAIYRRNLISLQALSERTQSQLRVHDQLLTRLGEEQVASHLDQPQVVVVDPPQVSEQPVNIRRMLFGVCALGFGLISGILMPLVAEVVDFRIRGRDRAHELTGLPLLAEVPLVKGLRNAVKDGAAALPLGFDESFRALRTSLRLGLSEDLLCPCLMVCSASPRDGRTSVAVRLALSLSAIGQYVLLIDADMRNPTLHKQLGQSNENGLSHMLAHRGGEVSVATIHSNLDFLGVGVRPPNPADMLHRKSFKRLIADCRANYDFIIMDSPPLDLVGDALVIGEQADGIIVVARDGRTTKSALSRCLARLAPMQQKVLGLVLNASKDLVPLEQQLQYEGRADIATANDEMLKLNDEHPFMPVDLVPLGNGRQRKALTT